MNEPMAIYLPVSLKIASLDPCVVFVWCITYMVLRYNSCGFLFLPSYPSLTRQIVRVCPCPESSALDDICLEVVWHVCFVFRLLFPMFCAFLFRRFVVSLSLFLPQAPSPFFVPRTLQDCPSTLLYPSSRHARFRASVEWAMSILIIDPKSRGGGKLSSV